MQYCKRCVMPSTRPGIKFNEQGICSACQSYEKRKDVDWEKRHQELVALCDRYRGMNGPGGYDCAIAVSGGKDSHFQVYYMKEVRGCGQKAGPKQIIEEKIKQPGPGSV